MDFLLVLTFFVGLGTSVLSGMSGGGGGLVIVPYYIFLGLSPASALATAKFGGLGTTVGALSALRGQGLIQKKLVVPFMIITFICAVISGILIPQIDGAIFQKMIGAAVLLLTPTLFIKKSAFQPGVRSRPWIIVGFIVFTFFSFAQTLVGTGMGMMVVLTLMFLFGLDALQASATKRVSQSVQALVLFILLAIQGFVVWTHGIAGLLGAVIGSYIGTKIGIKRGAHFVKIMLAGVMVVSGVILLVF